MKNGKESQTCGTPEFGGTQLSVSEIFKHGELLQEECLSR